MVGSGSAGTATVANGGGLTNQQEYAFGLSPVSGSSVNPITTPLHQATGKFSYTRRALALQSPALAYTIETSTTLVGWTVDAGATQSVSTVGAVETVEVTLSPGLLSNSTLFVRVVAQ